MAHKAQSAVLSLQIPLIETVTKIEGCTHYSIFLIAKADQRVTASWKTDLVTIRRPGGVVQNSGRTVAKKEKAVSMKKP